MTIRLSKETETAINTAVQCGRFASADEMVDSLVREYARRISDQDANKQKNFDLGLGSIGAMREDAEFLDEVIEAAMQARAATSGRPL